PPPTGSSARRCASRAHRTSCWTTPTITASIPSACSSPGADRGSSRVVDQPAAAPIEREDGARLLAQEAADDLDAALPQVLVGRSEHRALVEAEVLGVLAVGGEDQALDATPQRRPQTHRARLAGGRQLVGGQAGGGQTEGTRPFLGQNEGHHFAV